MTELSNDLTVFSKLIMNKLNDLIVWQQKQEQLVRLTQQKQKLIINEQKSKLNQLMNQQMDDFEQNHSNSTPTDDCLIDLTEYNSNINNKCEESDESVAQIRAQDNNQSFNPNNHFSNNSFSYLESSPVMPGIDGNRVKTFEELLEIKLKSDQNLYQEKSNKVSTNNENKTKKPFLRRGEGIKRFEPKNKIQPKTCLKSIEVETKPNINQSVKPKSSPKPQNPSLKDFKAKNTKNKFSLNVLKKGKNSKTEQKIEKSFKRKVIPLTTKTSPINSRSREIIITRNTPTVTDDENELYEYLEQVCDVIPSHRTPTVIRDGNNAKNKSSFVDKLENKDIDELETLLKKIENKKMIFQKRLSASHSSDDENESIKPQNTSPKVDKKKKVRWSSNSAQNEELKENLTGDDLSLDEPKSGAYSSSLKQQISELENRVSDLKLQSMKKEKGLKENHNKKVETNILSPISAEVTNLKNQIETLNKRLMSIESKSYDMISKKEKVIDIKHKSVCFNRNSTSNLFNTQNVWVKENINDTTIDLPNGDQMKVSKDNTVFYKFTNGVTQTTYADGLKITNFPNGQVEKVHKDGVKHITYTNGLQRIINPNSSEEVDFADGTIWRIHSDGTESLQFSNGDREIRTDNYKRREYKNGNIKTVYSDGTVESRYVSGRLRIKDKSGNLIVDSMVKHLNQHN